VKDLTVSNGSGTEVDAGAAAAPHQEHVGREAVEARHWAREVLRRGFFELLYLTSNLAIAGGGLLWLYQLLANKPARNTGLFLTAAVAISLCAYHSARWRASATMSRQAEKLTAWLIATLGLAMVWGGICFAFTAGILRWLSAPGAASWIVGGAAGLCGFAYMVAGEWRELRDCLAIPAASIQDSHSKESAA
jgi:hypothetical protein